VKALPVADQVQNLGLAAWWCLWGVRERHGPRSNCSLHAEHAVVAQLGQVLGALLRCRGHGLRVPQLGLLRGSHTGRRAQFSPAGGE
jgi:hypothetical protein